MKLEDLVESNTARRGTFDLRGFITMTQLISAGAKVIRQLPLKGINGKGVTGIFSCEMNILGNICEVEYESYRVRTISLQYDPVTDPTTLPAIAQLFQRLGATLFQGNKRVK